VDGHHADDQEHSRRVGAARGPEVAVPLAAEHLTGDGDEERSARHAGRDAAGTVRAPLGDEPEARSGH
jgi:hypothetical protein